MGTKLKDFYIKSVKGNEYKVTVKDKIGEAGGLKTTSTGKSVDFVKVHKGANQYGPEFYTFHGKQDIEKLNKAKPITATIPLYDQTKAKQISNSTDGSITYDGVKYYGSVTPDPG
jgi:hypothetical protein